MRVVALSCALALASSDGASGQREEDLPLDPLQRLEAIEQRIARSLAEIETASADRDRARAELDGLVRGRAATNRRLRERVRALYRLARAGALPLAGGAEALLRHVARLERLERMVQRDVRALRDLRARADALRAEVGRLAAVIDEARAQMDRLQAQKDALQADAQRALALAHVFTASEEPGGWEPSERQGVRVRDADPDPMPRTGFEAQRGELALPLTAPRAMREASREDGQGLELDGARGALVRAAAAGRVAFCDRHPAYGRLVILDHGGGWFTVYGGLGRFDVEVGDELSRGMQLGTLDGEPLFFQVRRGTRALDARAWLGI